MGESGSELAVPTEPTSPPAFPFLPHSHTIQMSTSPVPSSPPFSSSSSSPPTSQTSRKTPLPISSPISSPLSSPTSSSPTFPVTILNKVTPPSSVSLVLTVFIWYVSATFANSLNKVILTHFPYAGSLTLFETFFVFLFSFVEMQLNGTEPPPQMTSFQLYQAILPLAIGKDLGQVTTAMAVERLTVSFVHTVKSTSPVFTVFMASVWLGEHHSSEVVFSLIPIILGVWTSTMSEVELNLSGLVCAMLSVMFFVFQNLYSKNLMTSYGIHYSCLVHHTSIVALFVLIPFWFALDIGFNLTLRFFCLFFSFDMCPGEDETILLHTETGFDIWTLVGLFVFTAFCHYIQVVTAMRVLSSSSVVTYAVANTFKRVFVIVSSILYFHNTVSWSNCFGIALAIGGILWYNQARRRIGKVRPGSSSSMNV